MLLRTRMTMLQLLPVLLITAILIGAKILLTNKMEQRLAEVVSLSNALIWNQLVEDSLAEMDQLASEVNDEYELRMALKNNELAELTKQANKYVNLTGDLGNYDALQLFSKDLEQVYSSDSALNINQIDGLLQASADEPKQLIKGLVTDASGKLYASITFALKSRRSMMGHGVFIKKLTPVLEQLAERGDYAVGLTNGNGELQINVALPETDETLDFMQQSKQEAVGVINKEDRQLFISKQPVRNKADDLLGYLLVARDDTEKLAEIAQFELMTVVIIAVTIIASLVAMLWMLKRFLITPVISLRDYLGLLATGDFSQSIDLDSKDELGQIANSADAVRTQLGGIVKQLQDASDKLVSSSGDLLQISEQNLSQLNDQQSETELVSSAMSEMAATIQNVADNAGKAAAQAQEADNMAGNSDDIVNQMVTSMRDLALNVQKTSDAVQSVETHSLEIGSVLDVIRGIAEQTNLLALNAAIEAARAGDQGRGFAVVADEVRSLASRTQDSTEEIQAMIERLQQGTRESVADMQKGREKAENTVSLAESAGKTLQQISQAVSKINHANFEIASAAEQQGAVAKEVDSNIAMVKEHTDSILESGKTTNKSNKELANLAQDMMALASKFKT